MVSSAIHMLSGELSEDNLEKNGPTLRLFCLAVNILGWEIASLRKLKRWRIPNILLSISCTKGHNMHLILKKLKKTCRTIKAASGAPYSFYDFFLDYNKEAHQKGIADLKAFLHKHAR